MHTLPRFTPLDAVHKDNSRQPASQAARMAGSPPRAHAARKRHPRFQTWLDVPERCACGTGGAALCPDETRKALHTALNSRHFFHEVQLLRIVLDAFGGTAVLGE
jgi:hypothetical protein